MKYTASLSLTLALCAGITLPLLAQGTVTAPAAPAAVAAPAQPAKVGDTTVAKWAGNKKAAFLLMFDDGWPSHFQVALPEMKQRGLTGTFYICQKKGEYFKFENIWLTQMLEAGMVLGNHTSTHNGFQGKEDTEMEITGCTQYLLEKVPGKKPRLISFAMPGVKDHDYGGLDFNALLLSNNLVDRPPFRGHGATYHFQKLEQYVALADKAIEKEDMEYVVYHGLQRIKPDWSYQDMWAVPQTVFLPFLDALVERRDRGDLWITDHISWHKYKTQRESAQVKVASVKPKSIQLELTSAADPVFFDQPLTLNTAVPAQWTKCEVVQGTTKTTVAPNGGTLTFEAVPGAGTITIQPAA